MVFHHDSFMVQSSNEIEDIPRINFTNMFIPKKTKNIFYMISKPLKLQIISSPIPESAFGQCRVNIIPTGLMHAGKP